MNPLPWLDWLAQRFAFYARPFGHLVVSLVFLMAIPLLPLVLERWIDSAIKSSSWAITAAIYAICIGASSAEPLVFGLAVLASLVGSAAYGVVEAAPMVKRPEVESISFWIIIIFSVALLIERFYIHVLKLNPFLNLKDK